MRFVHVNHRYYPYVGGSERYMQEVSELLAGLGHDVTVITSNAHDLEYFWDRRRMPVRAPHKAQINGVEVRRLPVRHFPGNPFVFQASRRLMGEASRLRLPAWPFDLVSTRLSSLPDLRSVVGASAPMDALHVANLGLEGLGVAAAGLTAHTATPLIVTPFIHLGTTNDKVAKRYVSMPHQRKLLQSAQAVITMTQLEASFIKQLGVTGDKIRVSGVGINLAEVTGGDADRFRQQFSITGKLVGVASAVAFEKGARELVNGVYELRKRGHNVELVLAGPRLQQFDRWFDSLDPVQKEGIHVPGFIDVGQKRDMLAALDVLAMPSRTESFGIAYLEGWANRKPVLAANAGAVPELVRHGENGMLVEFGDHRAVAESLLHLLSNTDDAQRMGDSGHQMTVERFTWPTVLERVRAAYTLALGHDVVEVASHA